MAFALSHMGYLQCLLLSLAFTRYGVTASLSGASTILTNSEDPRNLNFSGSIANSTNAADLLDPKIPSSTKIGYNSRVRFNDTIRDAVITTIIQYPEAVLIEVQATAQHGPTTDPAEMRDVRLIFNLNGRSLYVEMKEWGQWGRPRLVQISPPTGYGPLPWHITVDLPQADLLIKNAGFDEAYDAVDVRWPITIPHARQQIYYYFGMMEPRPFTVAVGTRDMIVQANPGESLTVSVGDEWVVQNGTSTS